ncbi:uncharacterized protein TNCV_1944571 [Trichonephila clavipes]|nr:uncharacterized protein TNCV_1944571 [Trichonephila clavipes]
MDSGGYSASEKRLQQVSIRSKSQSDGQNYCCIAIKDTFQRLIIGLKEACWENWKIDRQMGRIDVDIRRCWQEWANIGEFQLKYNNVQLRATADTEGRLFVRSAITAPDSLLSTIRRATSTRVSTMTIQSG